MQRSSEANRSLRITSLTPEVIAELLAEIGPLRRERHPATLASRPRCRAVTAGAKRQLASIECLLATLAHLSAMARPATYHRSC